MVFILLDKGWVLVIIPNKVSRAGSVALLFSEKLINQLDMIIFKLTTLAGVSVTAMRVRPVASAISVDNILRLTRIKEY
jgi:hypothetical protein